MSERYFVVMIAGDHVEQDIRETKAFRYHGASRLGTAIAVAREECVDTIVTVVE